MLLPGAGNGRARSCAWGHFGFTIARSHQSNSATTLAHLTGGDAPPCAKDLNQAMTGHRGAAMAFVSGHHPPLAFFATRRFILLRPMYLGRRADTV
jgi:hypothetical protein